MNTRQRQQVVQQALGLHIIANAAPGFTQRARTVAAECAPGTATSDGKGGCSCYTKDGDAIKCPKGTTKKFSFQQSFTSPVVNPWSGMYGMGIPAIAEYPRYGVHHTERVREQERRCMGPRHACVPVYAPITLSPLSPYGTPINKQGLYGGEAVGAFGPGQEVVPHGRRITAARCLAQGGRIVTAGCTTKACSYNCVTVTRGRGGWITATEPIEGSWIQR